MVTPEHQTPAMGHCIGALEAGSKCTNDSFSLQFISIFGNTTIHTFKNSWKRFCTFSNIYRYLSSHLVSTEQLVFSGRRQVCGTNLRVNKDFLGPTLKLPISSCIVQYLLTSLFAYHPSPFLTVLPMHKYLSSGRNIHLIYIHKIMFIPLFNLHIYLKIS